MLLVKLSCRIPLGISSTCFWEGGFWGCISVHLLDSTTSSCPHGGSAQSALWSSHWDQAWSFILISCSSLVVFFLSVWKLQLFLLTVLSTCLDSTSFFSSPRTERSFWGLCYSSMLVLLLFSWLSLWPLRWPLCLHTSVHWCLWGLGVHPWSSQRGLILFKLQLLSLSACAAWQQSTSPCLHVSMSPCL